MVSKINHHRILRTDTDKTKYRHLETIKMRQKLNRIRSGMPNGNTVRLTDFECTKLTDFECTKLTSTRALRCSQNYANKAEGLGQKCRWESGGH